MYDLERITKRIVDIEKYKKDLSTLNIKSKKDLSALEKYHSASMLYFAIMNRVIDLGGEILIKENLGMHSRYSEMFDKLSKAGLVNSKESEELKNLVKYRNIIAHTYFDLSEEDIWKLINKMDIIDKFIEKIKKRVRKWIINLS